MRKFIREYAAYNVWANERMCNVIASLDEEKLNREIASSFPSVKKTLLHIWDVQAIWLERFAGNSLKSFPSDSFTGTKEDMIEGVRSTSGKLQALADGYDKKGLNRKITYMTLKSGEYTTPVYQMLSHVFNHSTYHRGQLTTMLRQVDITQFPIMDFTYFCRERQAESDVPGKGTA